MIVLSGAHRAGCFIISLASCMKYRGYASEIWAMCSVQDVGDVTVFTYFWWIVRMLKTGCESIEHLAGHGRVPHIFARQLSTSGLEKRLTGA